MDALRRRAARRLLHRRRRLAALQPGAVPARRPVRDRHVHRLVAADRRATRTRRPSPTAGCPGFGGAPNMGHDPHGRRHAIAGLAGPARTATAPSRRGRKLVVQMAQTFQAGGSSDVRRVARRCRGRQGRRDAAPAGDDLRRRRQSHVVTEEGVAYLYKAPSLDDRRPRLPRSPASRRSGATPTRGGSSGCAATDWSRFPRISRSRPGSPTARCSPRAASRTWSPGPAACTTRRHSSGTGDHAPPHYWRRSA